MLPKMSEPEVLKALKKDPARQFETLGLRGRMRVKRPGCRLALPRLTAESRSESSPGRTRRRRDYEDRQLEDAERVERYAILSHSDISDVLTKPEPRQHPTMRKRLRNRMQRKSGLGQSLGRIASRSADSQSSSLLRTPPAN